MNLGDSTSMNHNGLGTPALAGMKVKWLDLKGQHLTEGPWIKL